MQEEARHVYQLLLLLLLPDLPLKPIKKRKKRILGQVGLLCKRESERVQEKVSVFFFLVCCVKERVSVYKRE
jgi:hypothetical protein